MSVRLARSETQAADRPPTRRPSVRKYRDACWPAASGAVHKDDPLAGKSVVRVTSEEARQRDPQFEPRQRGAQTIMHAVTKRDVPVGAPRYVQAIRIFELLRIAVGGTNHNVKNLPLADILAAHPEVLPRRADSPLRRGVETQELLSGEIDQFRLA